MRAATKRGGGGVLLVIKTALKNVLTHQHHTCTVQKHKTPCLKARSDLQPITPMGLTGRWARQPHTAHPSAVLMPVWGCRAQAARAARSHRSPTAAAIALV
jgi:hypothetical protein